MKFLKSLAVLAAAILQVGVLYVSWFACVTLARAMGRFPPAWFGELPFFIGFLWFAVICGGLSIFTVVTRHRFVNWTAILAGLAIWAFLILSKDFSRPIAMPVFFAVGGVLLLTGNGLLVPYLRDACWRSKEVMRRGELSRISPSNRD
jgi:hypothetical protein